MICNDMTYIYIRAQHSKNFSSHTKYQLTTRIIAPLLALSLSNYHGLIPPINPQTKYKNCQSAALSLSAEVCYALA